MSNCWVTCSYYLPTIPHSFNWFNVVKINALGNTEHRTQHKIMQFHKESSVIAYHTWLCMTDRDNKGISEKKN